MLSERILKHTLLLSLKHNAEAEFVSAPAPQLPSLAKTYAALKPATAFTSRYSSRPYLPHSRPLPDCL